MRIEIARRLEELDATPAPSLERFDAGPAFEGCIAVLPSAFNPPTRAHLELLRGALAVEGVHRAAAMLTTKNVAKPVFGASLVDRIGMLLALNGSTPELGVLASNSARLIDQAQALRAAFPGAKFDFVVGYDTLVRLFDPGYYKNMGEELELFFASHRVIAANRGNASAADVERFVDEHGRGFGGRIIVGHISPDAAHVSSMDARAAIGEGLHAAMLPPEVNAYIDGRGLYRP